MIFSNLNSLCENIMLISWFILIVIQWNCVGDSIGFIDALDYSSIRNNTGIIGEISINIIFLIDFLFFKKSRGEQLELYSNKYLFIDFLSGPVALIGDIISLIFTSKLSFVCCVLRACKALSTIKARRVFNKVGIILPKVKDMFLCLFCVFFIFTYIATYLYADLFRKQYYFNSMGFSFFTMLQAMTLDGWGQIGRDVLKTQNMLTASFMILFVFIMAYFFWNILIGFILELLRSLNEKEQEQELSQIESSSLGNRYQDDNNQSDINKNNLDAKNKSSQKSQRNQLDNDDDNGEERQSKVNKKKSEATVASYNKAQINIDNNDNIGEEWNENDAILEKTENQVSECNENDFEERACFGSLYKKLVMGAYLLLVLDSMRHEDLRNIQGTVALNLQMSTGLLFTLHTLFILNKEGPRYQLERNHWWMIKFHILSGPVALIIDMYTLSTGGYIGLGAIFKLLKAFTVTRDTVMGAVMIFPTLLPAFLGIISIIYMLSLWSLVYLKNVESFWSDFNTSIYTFVQILTLDDWAARIVKDLLKNEKYIAPFLIVGFIFVANYFFLNMMVAFSCEVFKKVTTFEFVNRGNVKTTDFFESDQSQNNDRQYKSLQQIKGDLKYIQDTHLTPEALSTFNLIQKEKKIEYQDQQAIIELLKSKHSQQENTKESITFSFGKQTVQISQIDLKKVNFSLVELN